jgi:hypothetical protein
MMSITALALGAASVATAGPADPYASAPAYVKPVAPGVTTGPILTVGEMIPLTGGAPGDTFRVVGIPDGLGAHAADRCRRGRGRGRDLAVLMNHEFGPTQGGAAGPLPAGARVSEFLLDVRKGGKKAGAEVKSGRYFIEDVVAYDKPSDAYVLQAPGTRRIARLCSAFLADEGVGFDRPIFLHGEETATVGVGQSFGGLGGEAFATFDDSTRNLPWLGRMSWENAVVAPGTGDWTVVFCMEDGPSTGDALNSQLYMYVGTKECRSSDPLRRNGLRNGRLYMLVGSVLGVSSEASFNVKGASTPGTWVPVNWDQDASALDAESKAKNGFAFVRIEDGAADPRRRNRGDFWFVTTGRPGTANPNGRLYRLAIDPSDPSAGGATLTLVLDGTEGMVSPDNIDMNKHGELALCEDPNFTPPGRDSSVWGYDVDSGVLTRIAEMDRAAAKAHALAAHPGNTLPAGADVDGNWETSGIIDAERWLGRGGWLLDVQAHGLTIQPSAETVEGGQLLWMVWKP